jgi:hypothetical protein
LRYNAGVTPELRPRGSTDNRWTARKYGSY